ncbi:GDSL esterase/lipase At1g31550-like [Phoenix dactylifera]|uniref:GDSL esterase/lipase At1g31550-like n=1 Tax=Phoenix dactylifera TaxID=42345 RepID=A0A8B7BIZ1_PHODC|nr:GDSL esterase/lipase At1g31550-like [Phoenix dactylifera]
MASSTNKSTATVFCKAMILLQLPLFATVFIFLKSRPATTCYNSIISFGDSIADTGNYLVDFGEKAGPVGHPPYGKTYFRRPTGRFSDGRVIIDFIAQAMGLPLVPPYLVRTSKQDLRYGVNFAVAGVTALDGKFFRDKGMVLTWPQYSLATQIQWFKKLLPSLCSSKSDCESFFSKSLVLMGEIGGNDYNHPFAQLKAIDEIRTYVPSVVNITSWAINSLIELGAKTLVVPGIFPLGCVSAYLTVHQSGRREDYDPQTGCIKWLNEFSEYHNSLLQTELDRLRRLHPRITIIYANYYDAAMDIYRHPLKYGFDAPLAACCGGGGPYNFNLTAMCGAREDTVCSDPSKHVCWDGMHLTDAAYEIIARGLLQGSYASAPITQACLLLEPDVPQLQRVF